MFGVTIIVARGDGVPAALELAAVYRALEEPARLFVHGTAVEHLLGPDDPAQPVGGQGTRGELLQIALEMGVEVAVCQAGLALSDLTLATTDPRVVAGGLVGLVATLGNQRLVTF